MSLVFTLPGKLGDCLHQWPVAYWYCAQQNKKCTLWLDENTLKPLVNLFAAQPCVEAVELKGGIKSYHMGGQPWDFGLTTKDHADHTIYHLGMRKFPTRQITLETLDQVPLNVEAGSTAGTITVPGDNPARGDSKRLALHGTFTSHTSGVPSFWRFLSDREKEIRSIFGTEVYFTGTPGERKRGRDLYPEWQAFDDGGDFLNLARFMQGCSLVIGAGSSNVVLASLLGIPSIRVHDPLGDHPKVIWSNLGPDQINDTEEAMRGQILSLTPGKPLQPLASEAATT